MRQQRHNPFSHISSLHKQRKSLDVVYPHIYVEGLLLQIAPASALDRSWISLGSLLDRPWTDPGSTMGRSWIGPGSITGSALDRPWICPGSILDRPWIDLGSNLDRSWMPLPRCPTTPHPIYLSPPPPVSDPSKTEAFSSRRIRDGCRNNTSRRACFSVE